MSSVTPKFLGINAEGAQSLGPRLVEPVVPIPNIGLQFHHTTSVVCAIDGVRPGALDVDVRITKPAFITK